MSATAVPCPGSRGASTVRPAAAMAWATPRMENVLPVNPWITSAPFGPPDAENGSAPAMTGALTPRMLPVDHLGARGASGRPDPGIDTPGPGLGLEADVAVVRAGGNRR